jgi:hypothetical protein
MIKKSIAQDKRQKKFHGMRVQATTLKATNWKSIWEITKVQEFFSLDLLFKLYIKLFRQI